MSVTILPITLLIIFASFGQSAPTQENQNDETYMDQNTKATNFGESFSDESDQTQSSQNSFYPSYFQQPLGHSRPYYYNQQEAAYSQRPFFNGFDQTARFSGYKDINPAPKTENLGILGSGNFGVIPGGTFYNDNDNADYGGGYEFFHNGHGRPSAYFSASNPKPYTHEQFANFRDFADINTQNDRQYSQYVVVYANKNQTKEMEEDKHAPKNIIESLTLLDLQTPTTTETIPEKKLSKSKRKLALLLPEKKHLKKNNKSKDLDEPLLADS